MEFSKEERKEIDKILAEVKEEQKQNGNKLYSFEEVVESLLNKTKKGKDNYRLSDISY